MDNNNNLDIRNQEEVPSTHFFIYQKNKYPFNFDFFKHFSKYISENRIILEDTKEINLLDSKDEDTVNLNKETIENFIKYIQRETISINDDNVVKLNFLATKYQVNSLIKHTDNYISNHKNDLIFDLFSLHKKESNPTTTSKFEDIISEHLLKYINDDRLLDLGVPTLFRILTKYALKKSSTEEIAKSIEAFLFKCLDKYGRGASILFSVIENDQITTETLKTLISNYFNVFDFHFINPQIIRRMHEEHQTVVNELEAKIEIQKIEINQLKKVEGENDEIKSKLFEYEDKISKLSEDNSTKDVKIKEQSNEINKLKDEIELLKTKIEEAKKVENIEVFNYIEGQEFNGIIKHLIMKTGGNIHDNSTISVTSNNNQSSYLPKNLADLNEKDYYAYAGSKDFWICFDFKNMKVELTHYSIKSYANSSQGHLKNWTFEVSNDGIKWDQIDEHNDCKDLCGNTISKTFNVRPNNFSRYCRLHHTGEFWEYSTNHHPGFKKIELYGRLKTP